MHFDYEVVLEQFRAALRVRGIVPPAEIIANGKIQRCDAEGRKNQRGAAYKLHMDGMPAGGFENWHDGRGWENWKADVEDRRTPQEKARFALEIQEKTRLREMEARSEQATAQERAGWIWYRCEGATPDYPYLAHKGVPAVGIGFYKGALVIPMRDIDGELHSLQFIQENGKKRFLQFGRVEGCFFGLGEPGDKLYVVEGYATAGSIHLATGDGVAVAFNEGNLLPVARALRKKYPHKQIVFGSDNDILNNLRDKPLPNAGLKSAYTAAREVEGTIAIPEFPACSASDSDPSCKVRGSVFRRLAAAASLDPDTRFYRRGILPLIDRYVEQHASALASLSKLPTLTWGTITVHLRDAGLLTDETDFNDMHRTSGLDAVRDCLERTVPPPAPEVQELCFDIGI